MNQDILNFSQMHAEPAWLSDLRQKAALEFENLELPNIERVKINRWGLDHLTISENEEIGSVPTFTEIPNHPLLVQAGSQTVMEQMTKTLAEQGVIFTDFNSALAEIPELVEENFGAVVPFNESRLTAANAATFNSGLVLYVPDGVEVLEPIESILMQEGSSEVPFNKRILLIVGKNAKVDYLERLETSGEQTAKATANLVVEVIAKAGAQVKFAAIDRLGKNVTASVIRRGLIGDNATVDWSVGVMNDGNVVADFDSDLKGNGSHSQIKVVGISTGHQTQGIDTRVTNFGLNSVGHILQNGVILDKGTLTFNAIGHIIKGAKNADAQQSSHVLMLSDKGRGDANPILLIDENEVTAGHAASVGQVDEEDLFYLQSRGLDEETAKRLVIRGFLGSVVSEIPVKSVQAEFIETIERKLGM
ncbi:Iron-sulfur cluster assembly protein SufD [Lactococcus cremoris]|uniref:Iron-sulfur cluster assembly protein SufD n=1 Tax=Lactococcus lactis subsp. cremoris TaxID=1359 RepID=A0A161W0K5_LACLC|nr:Fe-S cluster assembly protein SufD [Lactococcus cremoris]KZK05600.1 Iron-sulfur cluster assembly protein SufD [Lactococcus cremoris]